jgi:hypothetical protein
VSTVLSHELMVSRGGIASRRRQCRFYSFYIAISRVFVSSERPPVSSCAPKNG